MKMTTKTTEIKPNNHDSFIIKVHRNFDGWYEQRPNVLLYVEGIIHPMLNFQSNYVGEETKNPQLKKATDVLETIFERWIATLPATIQASSRAHNLKNQGANSKYASVSTSKHSLCKDEIKSLYEAADDLENLITQNIEAIEKEIENGKSIALESPEAPIRSGFHKAMTRLAMHENIDTPSAIDTAASAFPTNECN